MSLSTKRNRFTFHKLALETMKYKDGLGIMFYLLNKERIGFIETEELGEGAYEPRRKGKEPYKAFRSKDLAQHFIKCFGITKALTHFEVKRVNGAVVIELIKLK